MASLQQLGYILSTELLKQYLLKEILLSLPPLGIVRMLKSRKTTCRLCNRGEWSESILEVRRSKDLTDWALNMLSGIQ